MSDPEPAQAPPDTSADPVEAAAVPVPPPEPDYRDLFLRASAELDNYRKRVERERQHLLQFASEGVVRRLLDPYDSFDRAIADLERVAGETPEPTRAALSRSLTGLRALKRQLSDLFASEGVGQIPADGADFDPEVHEALVQVPSETLPAGKVVQVLQPGYTIRGKVVRPARVAVSSGPAADPKAPDTAPASPPNDSSSERKPGKDKKHK